MSTNIIFEPPRLRERGATIPIQRIILAALAPKPARASGRQREQAPCTALTNHWVLHLTQSRQRSIRLDAQRSHEDVSHIGLVFKEMNEGIPADIVQTYDIALSAGMTLATVIEIMEKGRFNRYRFDVSGHGCRYWAWCLVGFMKENGFVTSKLFYDGARVSLQQVWLEGGQLASEEQQTHLVPGHFY